MADQEMIDRVAKALVLRDTTDEYSLARAAINAMREPTEKMLEPVTNADGFFKVSDPKQAYQAMIEAILND